VKPSGILHAKSSEKHKFCHDGAEGTMHMINDEQMKLMRAEELLTVLKHSSGESDRGITLIIASHIEVCLQRIIESFLIDSKDIEELFEGPYAPLGSLSGKTKFAYLLGLITKHERDKIDAVRQVRNVFAHEINANFEHPKIKKICEKPIVDSGRMCNRDEFLHMAQNTVLPLLYRDSLVATWKRHELVPEAEQDAAPDRPASR
jgi:hypothetical protein